MKRVALLLCLLLVTPAHASRLFLAGFESGGYDAANTDFLFDADSSGTNQKLTTSSPTPRGNFCEGSNSLNRGLSCTSDTDCGSSGQCFSQPGNDYSLEFTPTSEAEWVELSTSYLDQSVGQSQMYTHFLLNVTTTGTNALRVVTHDDGSTNTGCFLQLSPGTTGKFNVEVYYKDDTKECTAGSSAGTECISPSDCTGNEGEAFCSGSTYATLQGLSTGRWYEIVLGQAISGGQATCPLTEAGRPRGGAGFRKEGVCGSVDGFACASSVDCLKRCDDWTIGDDPEGDDTCTVNADCSGNCITQTCDTSALVNTKRVTFGPRTATTDTWKFNIDDVILDGSTSNGLAVMRIEDLRPDGDGATQDMTRNGCPGAGNLYDCINEDLLDTSDYILANNSAVVDTAIYTLTNISDNVDDAANLHGAAGIAFYGAYRDGNSGSGDDQDVMTCLETGSACSTTFNDDITQLATPTIAGYELLISASYNTVSEVNAMSLRTEVDKTACSTSCQTRVLNMVAEVEVEMNSPTLPGIANDVNGDGTKRFCLTGDSTVDDADFHNLLASQMEDFDHVIAHTRGGTTIGDLIQEANDIADGTATYMGQKAILGNAGKCDYLMISTSANTISGGHPKTGTRCSGGSVRGKTCSTDSDCTGGGTCDNYDTGFCWGGTNHGAHCVCARHSAYSSNPSGSPEAKVRYCLNNADSKWLSTSSSGTCTTCTTASDCLTNIACTVNSDCASGDCDGTECRGVCTGGKCVASNSLCVSYGAHNGSPSNWLRAGCTGADGCSGGLCVSPTKMAEIHKQFGELLDILEARTGGDAVKIIMAPQPSTSVGDCWNVYRAEFDSSAHIQKQLVLNRGHGYVNLNAWFKEYCYEKSPRGYGSCTQNSQCLGTGTNESFCHANGQCATCLRDGVHWTSPSEAANSGMGQQADAIEACMENGSDLLTVQDGTCVSNNCTTGKVGSYCITQEDCNLYHCAL